MFTMGIYIINVNLRVNWHTGFAPCNGYAIPSMYYKNVIWSFSIFRHFTYDLSRYYCTVLCDIELGFLNVLHTVNTQLQYNQ